MQEQLTHNIEQLFKTHHFDVIYGVEDLPEDVLGRIDYIECRVKLNKNNITDQNIIALFHEAGHLLHFIDHGVGNGFIEDVYTKQHRESEAYTRGWRLLELFDPGHTIVPLAMWDYFHK